MLRRGVRPSPSKFKTWGLGTDSLKREKLIKAAPLTRRCQSAFSEADGSDPSLGVSGSAGQRALMCTAAYPPGTVSSVPSISVGRLGERPTSAPLTRPKRLREVAARDPHSRQPGGDHA